MESRQETGLDSRRRGPAETPVTFEANRLWDLTAERRRVSRTHLLSELPGEFFLADVGADPARVLPSGAAVVDVGLRRPIPWRLLCVGQRHPAFRAWTGRVSLSAVHRAGVLRARGCRFRRAARRGLSAAHDRECRYRRCDHRFDPLLHRSPRFRSPITLIERHSTLGA